MFSCILREKVLKCKELLIIGSTRNDSPAVETPSPVELYQEALGEQPVDA